MTKVKSTEKVNKIKVSEIFISRQGECFLTGQRCLFIRVAGCNLLKYCSVLCDTGRLVGIDVSIDDLSESVREIIDKNDIRNVVITGGEPMLYANELLEFIDKVDRNVLWQFETNGTIEIDVGKFIKSIDNGNKIKIVVSPKSNKNFSEVYYGLYKATLKYGEPCVVFKFVVLPDVDLIEGIEKFIPFFTPKRVREIVSTLIKQGVSKNDIWLMPFARNVDDLEDISELVCKLAMMMDVNYSDRLHIRFDFK